MGRFALSGAAVWDLMESKAGFWGISQVLRQNPNHTAVIRCELVAQSARIPQSRVISHQKPLHLRNKQASFFMSAIGKASPDLSCHHPLHRLILHGSASVLTIYSIQCARNAEYGSDQPLFPDQTP
jgi:hypothetical protein